MTLPPFSCLLLHGSTIHRGGGNSSPDTHRLLGASWTQGHMRQEENQYLATSKEDAMNLPEETQRLIGYKINAPMG
jgi:ectoine hydroxylase-related dioxygenase (phytanoyl-CoA dioxygenase family)